MTDPLEIRRAPVRGNYLRVTADWTCVVAGALIIVSAGGVLVTEDRARGLGTVVMVAFGAYLATLGVRMLRRDRGILDRSVLLKLDDHGVSVRTGTVQHSGWAHLPWRHLEAVAVSTIAVGPPIYKEGLDATMLRFVADSDSAIVVEDLTTFDKMKAASIDLSPAAGCLALLHVKADHPRIQHVRDWLALNRPDVAITG